MAALALQGIRVLDLTMWLAGPYSTKLLADMGAEIIKLEAIQHPDGSRGPVRVSGSSGVYPHGQPGEDPWNRAGYFNEHNRNKLGITLDLTRPLGIEMFKRLVRVSDIVVENYSPRVMKKFGLDYPALKEINPGLIMLSLPGFGQSGPYRDYVTYGTSLEAIAGLTSLRGFPDRPPVRTGPTYSDYMGGLNGACAVLIALHHRTRTGRGQYVDFAQLEGLTSAIGEQIMDYTMNGRVQSRIGNHDPYVAPHSCYRCKGEDKWVTIAIFSDEQWGRFCRAAGHPEWTIDARFTTNAARKQNEVELDRLIEGWTGEKEHYEVMRTLQKAGIAAGSVLSAAELLKDPHFKARGYYEVVPNPNLGTFPFPGIPWRMSKTPGHIRMPAPRLGEHNDYIFREVLGLTEEEITRLISEEIIGTIPTGARKN